MTDLGLYNFIKNALSRGTSEEDILVSLRKGGWSDATITQAITDAKNNRSPGIPASPSYVQQATVPALSRVQERPLIITILCGYFFITWFETFINFTVQTLYTISQTTHLPPFLSFNSETLPAYLALLGTIAGIIGIWYMKKWGLLILSVTDVVLITYTVLQLQSYTSLSEIILRIFLTFLIPVFLIIISIIYWPRFS